MDRIKHPAYKYARDNQSVAFSRINLTSGQSKTATLTMSFRFIALRLAATVYIRNAGVVTEVINVPITTILRQHSQALDNSPIPLRAAWGTGRRPTRLLVPWALENGTAMSVECANIIGLTGVTATANSYDVYLTLLGYQPSDEEFETIRKFGEDNFVKPYQTYTLAPIGIPAYLDVSQTNRNWSTDFTTNFYAVRATAQAFNINAASEVNGFIVPLEDPPVQMVINTKSANLNTDKEALRCLFGDADYPAPVSPPMSIKRGDLLRAAVDNLTSATAMQLYLSYIGYVPSAKMLRVGDIERLKMGPQPFPVMENP